VQTCYAKWLSICSAHCEFNALVYVHCVEWNSHYFYFFICRILACMCCLLVLPYYMVNTDEYIYIYINHKQTLVYAFVCVCIYLLTIVAFVFVCQ